MEAPKCRQHRYRLTTSETTITYREADPKEADSGEEAVVLMQSPLSSTDRLSTPRSRTLVDVVSGSFGAGHDAAADQIVTQLQSAGYATRVCDIVDLMQRPLGSALPAAYRHQVQLAPSAYRSLLRCANRGDRINKIIVAAMRHAGQQLLEMAGDHPATIVSTHPFASQALGDLRARGRLQIPVVTYLTDMSVHRAWVHRSVSLHLALHQLPAEQATRLGAPLSRVVRPAVPAAFSTVGSSPRSQVQSRRALGLPLDERLVLITGGSWGMGDLQQSAAEVSATGLATPVVLCGRNQRLRRKLETSRSTIALDWVDNMPLLLGSIDCVVQNSGGYTSLEALMAGIPILTYRCIAGHGETNAAALAQAGLVPWIKNRADLAAGLTKALSTRPGCHWATTGQDPPDVVTAIFSELSTRLT